MTCGCELEPHEFIPKKSSARRCCVHHPGNKIRVRSIICERCGVVREFSKTGGNIPTLCKKCQKLSSFENTKAWRLKNPDATIRHQSSLGTSPKRSRYDHLRDESRLYCKHKRDTCLNRYAYYTSMPCLNCERFEDDPMVPPDHPASSHVADDLDLYTNWESTDGC